MKDKPQFLRIAKIVGTHGLAGRLKIIVITDIIERFTHGNSIFLKSNEEYREYKCSEFIEQFGKPSLLKLENIDDRDKAFLFKGVEIYIDKKDAEKSRTCLGKEAFYYYDLFNCEVFLNGDIFGKVVDIIDSGENSVLVLENNDGKEFFIPFIQSMVDTKNVFKGRIDINPIEGLFEL